MTSKSEIKKQRSRQAQAKYRLRRQKRRDWLKANIDQANSQIAKLQQQIKLKKLELCESKGSDKNIYSSNGLSSCLDTLDTEASLGSWSEKNQVVSESVGEPSEPVIQLDFLSPVDCGDVYRGQHPSFPLDPVPLPLPMEDDISKVIDPRLLHSINVKRDTDTLNATEEQRLEPMIMSQSFNEASKDIHESQADDLQVENGFLQGNNWNHESEDCVQKELKFASQYHPGAHIQNTTQKLLSLVHILTSGQGSFPA